MQAAIVPLLSRSEFTRSRKAAFLLGLAMLAVFLQTAWSQATASECSEKGCPPLPMYDKRDCLQATLLATRQQYSAWLAEQTAARKAVEFEPWFVTSTLSTADGDKHVPIAERIDLNARLANGKTLWTPRKDLVDGKVAKFVAGSGNTVVYLTRTIRAKKPVRLTIGIGGGDRLDVWVNGRGIGSAQTRLTSGRYGCSQRVDGTRVNQLLVSLDLEPGDNTLLVRLTPGAEPSFYFSPSPDPVPRFWERVRHDFPPAQNPLLDLVHADWLTAKGWFAQKGTELENQFIDRLTVDCRDNGAPIRRVLNQLKQDKVDRNDPRWLDLCVRASVVATLRGDLDRLRAAAKELGRTHPDDYPTAEFLAKLEEFEQRLSPQANLRLDPANATTQALMAEMPRIQREMLVDRNPLLSGTEIVFVKRYTYNSKHYYDDFQHISRWGGNLCVLSLSDGRVREIVPELNGGVFDRYDLSFDAHRIVFGYRRPKLEGYRLWEIGVDGSGLRQVTHPPANEEKRIAEYGITSTGDGFYGLMGYRFWTDDVHPCYLPDGGLCFASTRSEHGVLCTPNHYLACTNLFRMDADGSDLRPLSYGALSEFTPTMMEDGRILYNRWEYVYKGIAAVQPLWVMRPDGSASEEFYGDNVTNPGVFWQARQVPNHSRLAVCIGCGHEPLGIGQVLLLDLSKEKRSTEPMTSLTPNVRTQSLRGLYQLRNGVWREDIYGPFYADPYPLSDKFFLVSCNPDQRYNDEDAYGIHLLDAFGNRVPIYDDPGISCWQPMLLRPRRTPPALPSVQAKKGTGPICRNGPEGASHKWGLSPFSPAEATATVFLNDVYEGLPGVERGTVKYLRVMEQIPKPWAAEVDPLRGEDRRADGFGGHIVVSRNAHIWIAVLRGIVPIEEDGSAFFEVPARRNLFFQALDKDFMEVQRMRTFVNFEPGEKRGCIGCHEHRRQAPVSQFALSIGRTPMQLSAQPGEVAPRPLYYPTDVQPILDRHCVNCHNDKDPKVAPDLRGEMTTLFNRSYESIFDAGLVDTIREWAGLSYSMENAESVPPYSYGSHRSKLVDVLKAGHYDVKLSREEWIKLATWIDCGAPYYGSYYGRRNLVYRGQPDFRPVPTVESACGIRPDFPDLPAADPLPAQLLAWLPLDGGRNGTAQDASGNGRDGQVIGAEWIQDGKNGPVPTLDGKGYVSVGGLGLQEAISVSLWVKPSALPNRWNPLLFTDSGSQGAFHFSLLEDGTPNVAVNSGAQQWTHRRASTPLATNRWSHVVVTCDARLGGKIAFYVDGQKSMEYGLGLAIPLDIESSRLGAWRSWENNAAAGFRGELDEARIYQGVLTQTQVSEIFASGRSGKPASERMQK